MGRVRARPAGQALSADAPGPGAADRRNCRLAAVRIRGVEDSARPMKRSLRSWLWRVPIEQEVEDELALHAEMRRREGKTLDSGEMEQVCRACLAIAWQRERQMRLT